MVNVEVKNNRLFNLYLFKLNLVSMERCKNINSKRKENEGGDLIIMNCKQWGSRIPICDLS